MSRQNKKQQSLITDKSANKRLASSLTLPSKEANQSKRGRYLKEDELIIDNEDDEFSDDDTNDDFSEDQESENDGLRPVEGFAVGIDACNQTPGDLEELQSSMFQSQLNFICLDMEHATALMDELSMDTGELNGVIVGKINLSSTANEASLQGWLRSGNKFYNSYAFAAHLGLQAVLVELPITSEVSTSYVMQLCRLLTNTLSKFSPTAPQVWLQISADSWYYWDSIRHGIDHHNHVYVAVDYANVTDETIVNDAIFRRWKAEPIKAVLLSTAHLLVSNNARIQKQKISNLKTKKSKTSATSSSLSLDFQSIVRFLRHFFDFKIHFILVAAPDHSPASIIDSEILEACLDTLHSQFSLWREEPMAEEEIVASSLLLDQQFSFSFRDKLQTPLDPLHQNLDLETYRVMEEDPIKYQRYEMALIAATRDLKHILGKSVDIDHPIRILVVGPGRGPLIASSLVAAAVNQVPIEVIAIEKNRNAVRTLKHRFAPYIVCEPSTSTSNNKANKNASAQKTSKASNGQSSQRGIVSPRVRIIEGDMRDQVSVSSHHSTGTHTHASQQEGRDVISPGSVHIIVSELLGSFADNEASPECLYAIEHVLHPIHGVMIPQSYTSYLVPVAASHLWQQARVMFHQHSGKNQHQQQGLDYPYVVHFHAHTTYGGPSQPAFQVKHLFCIQHRSSVRTSFISNL